MRVHIRFGLLILWFIAPVAIVVPASAQTSDFGKWEVEIHGGGVWPTNPAGGTASLPGPGQVFTTEPISPPPPPPPSSRRESSWYFGDGAVLFNQAVVALFNTAATPVTPARITSLDPVLERSFATRQPGASIGFSVTRAFTPRLGAELRVDYSRTRLLITESASDAIEATRASFIPAFEGMVRFNRNRVLNSLTSTVALEDGSGHQLAASGALVVNLKTSGNLIPYATVGGGLVSTGGKTPSTTLSGNYQFVLASGAPVNETDVVTVTAARDDRTWAGILGGGVKYRVSPRWGIRLGISVALSKNAVDTVLDAAPSVTLGLQPAGRGALGGEPSIQFSNTSDPVAAGGVRTVAASSLTAPAITGFRTFSASGVVSHTNLNAGLFWRF